MSAVVCCILCGLTAIDLPDEHGCQPNLPPDQVARIMKARTEPKQDFYDLFREAGERPRREQRPVRVPSEVSGSGKGRVAGLCRTVAAAPEGQRNSTLFWAACRVADMASTGELSDTSGALHGLVDAAAQAGLGGREIAATIRSAMGSNGVVA